MSYDEEVQAELEEACQEFGHADAVREAIPDGSLFIGGRFVKVRALFLAGHWSGALLGDENGNPVLELEEGSDVVYDSEGEYAPGLKQPLQVYLPVPDP